jgi:hypothetical protein
MAAEWRHVIVVAKANECNQRGAGLPWRAVLDRIGRLRRVLAQRGFIQKSFRLERYRSRLEPLMQPENELDELAIRHGSDKFGSHWYTKHYHRNFARIRTRDVHILEIGIGGYDDPAAGGASLKMWRDYFPLGEIYGLDFYDKSGLDGDRIRTFCGSQADPRVMGKIVDSNPRSEFDVIIDDGSHRGEHVIATFLAMFQFVKDGGWYVIEDTQTSYWPDYGGDLTGASGPLSMIPFFRKLVDCVNWQEVHRPSYVPTFFDRNISSIEFVHNMIFINRGSNTADSNVLVNSRLPYV